METNKETVERLPEGGDRPVLDARLVGLMIECPLGGNPVHCELYALRQAPVLECLAFLHGLTVTDRERLLAHRRECLEATEPDTTRAIPLEEPEEQAIPPAEELALTEAEAQACRSRGWAVAQIAARILIRLQRKVNGEDTGGPLIQIEELGLSEPDRQEVTRLVRAGKQWIERPPGAA